jgi:hypothetical protein
MRSLFVILIALLSSAERPTVSITWERKHTEFPALESNWCVMVDIDAGNEYRTIRYCPRAFPVKPLNIFLECMRGPGVPVPPGCRTFFDRDGDGDVDMRDLAATWTKGNADAVPP